ITRVGSNCQLLFSPPSRINERLCNLSYPNAMMGFYAGTAEISEMKLCNSATYFRLKRKIKMGAKPQLQVTHQIEYMVNLLFATSPLNV
ncbi:hypothetical protein, partial [Morganella morganii]|uniref:hypothetical protein n=1 Tax=Morganella morganii TaxID=582 RepID=UPI0019633012